MHLVHIVPNTMNRRGNTVLMPQVCLCCNINRLIKTYRCDEPLTERPREDLDSQQLRTKRVYGQVHWTCARQVRIENSPRKADNAKATVPAYVCNGFELHQPNHLEIEQDEKLQFQPEVHSRSHQRSSPALNGT